MTLTELAYRHRPLVGLLAVVLMAFGAFSYFNLPAREDPKVTIREAVVTTSYPGLSAERIERLITKTLEEQVRRVPEVEELRSTSMPGQSIIHVVIEDRYFNLDQIWDDVRQEVRAAQDKLPEGASPPQVNDEFGDVAVITAALTSDDWAMRDIADMAEHIRDRLYAVDGTKRVDLLGIQQERMWIEFSNARLAELGVGPDALQQTLSRQNVIRPGGELDTGDRAFLIEPSGNFESTEDVGDTLIRLPGEAGVVPLRDVATVRRGYRDPPARKAYYNGKPAVILAVSMLEGRSVLDFSKRATARLDEVRQSLPAGYRLDLVTLQERQVEKAVYGVSFNVLQTLAILLAVVVLFLGLRTGLIVGAIVPTVMLITVAIMGLFEMTLQRMSLATLVIALGLLVDNGIVVAEEFKRRLGEGVERDATLRAVGSELALPLLSSTLTTILVFLPLMLAEHVSGEYTRSISLIMLISLLTSWVGSMTVTPLLCHRFIKAPEPGATESDGGLSERIFRPLVAIYDRLLRRVLRARWAFLGAMTLLLVASVYAIGQAPSRFFPASDRAQVLVYLDLPTGVTARTTDARLQDVFEVLNDKDRFPQVQDYGAYVGFGGPRFVLSLTPIDPAPNQAFMVLNVGERAQVDPTVKQLRSLFRQEFPGLFARVAGMFLGPSDSSKIDIQATGPDAEVITRTADRIAEILRQVPGSNGVRHDWQNRIAKIRVAVDQARARRAGVTSADIAEALETYFSGRQVTEFREGDDIFPVVARAEAGERTDLDRLKTLSVYGDDGRGVPLMQVADFELQNAYARIHREDMTRTVTVEARNDRMTAEDMVPLIRPDLERLRADLPPGHGIELDGVVKESAEGQAALAANAPLCLGVIVLLLVAQFNGFRRPAMILATMPLVLIGVAIGLYVMGANFGFMPILGLYALAGIVVNNAIVLIDRIDIERAQGYAPAEAVVKASVRRLRPILMTTATTIVGLLPLIVFQDALFFGMASVMAFGLGVATVLTLGIIPVLYSLFCRTGPAQRES
ncbi:efflux RND transporter permease subunit [Rhodovibrio salinarum]|uniref:AcrB/AcrD/AcrF family protein n=1 Tax=Rhodovibrio salinarum TaxID=1087 RepID=A0A934UZY4_9PROT|nr:efflux RND transporter permease subunit [Rhodovibrio salinarum]MBK1697228.1 AcrB/AcrD/AcrF family protein [Rhodovibrio salinarum]